jgi:hypothetical protein
LLLIMAGVVAVGAGVTIYVIKQVL